MSGDQSLWADGDDDRIADGEGARDGRGVEKRDGADRTTDREYGELHPGSRIESGAGGSERRVAHLRGRSGERLFKEAGSDGGEIHPEPVQSRGRGEGIPDRG